MTHDFNEIQQRIQLVTEDILTRHPGCSYTVTVLLWDDGTSCVECRHGDEERLYMSYHYKGELKYIEEEYNGDVVIKNKVGIQFWADFPEGVELVAVEEK